MIVFVAALLLASISALGQVDKSMPQNVSALLAQSEALQAKGDFPQAELMMRRFLARENLPPVNKILALNALGVLMNAVDRNREAESHFQRALDLAENNPEILPLTLLRIRLNLSTVYLANRRYQKAQALLNKISETEIMQAHEPWRFASLKGAVAIRMADYELGKQVFEAQLKNLDPAKPSSELAITLNNLGMIALYKKNYVTANKYLSQAAAMWRANSGIRQSNMLRTLVNLAVAQQAIGDKDAARATVAESLNLARTQFGDIHPLTAGICEVSAGILSKLGSKREAKELKHMAQQIRQQLPSTVSAGAVVDITELSALR